VGNVTGFIEAEVKPTEDQKKVEKAIQNFFTYTSLESVPKHGEKLLIARIKGREGLLKFFERLRQERILNAARKIMIKGLKGKSITFCLNKQVAYVNHISFCEPVAESSLGPIRVNIGCDNPRELIDWLTQRTV
jgi:predicted RNA binding protein with dsRBD fold (UPF0201 family)